MGDMTGNEQYRNGEWVADKAETQAEGLAANAFATLALAYEQRTANLLTCLEAISSRASREEISELSGAIRKRLGLEAL